MINFTRPLWALFLCLSLASCSGGDGGASSGAAVAIPNTAAQCTGNDYFPMCSGTGIVYSVKMINSASVDPSTHEITINSISDQPNPFGSFLIQQYSTHTCSDMPGRIFFANEYQFNNTGKFIPPPVNPAITFWEESTNVNGVPAIAETDGGYISPGEIEITMNPVVGEVIDVHSVLAKPDGQGCSTATVTNPDFHTTYRTMAHYASWNGWQDVWETTIVEWTGDDPPAPTYYEQEFAKGIGMVGLRCWRPAGGNNYNNCGNQYIAIYEGATQ